MRITVGDRLPDAELRIMTGSGPTVVRSHDVLGEGRVILFAVPGAFTPGCSNVHLPGFVENAGELRARGVDRIACVAWNDAYVMHAWGLQHEVGDAVLMLADGNGDFTRAMGMERDAAASGLGTRSHRYAAVLDDGVITSIDVDESGIDLTSCSNLLLRL